jgi:hypothetical protein
MDSGFAVDIIRRVESNPSRPKTATSYDPGVTFFRPGEQQFGPGPSSPYHAKPYYGGYTMTGPGVPSGTQPNKQPKALSRESSPSSLTPLIPSNGQPHASQASESPSKPSLFGPCGGCVVSRQDGRFGIDDDKSSSKRTFNAFEERADAEWVERALGDHDLDK